MDEARRPRASSRVQTNGARVPPHDLDAEAALLGAMLLSSAASAVGLGICEADDFYAPSHQRIFAAVGELVNRGAAVDAVTVAGVLRETGDLDEISVVDTSGQASTGVAALVTLMSGTPSTSRAETYAAAVRDNAVLRDLIGIGREIAEDAYEVADPSAALSRARERIEGVRPTNGKQVPDAVDVTDFVAVVDAEYDWLVPGLLERGDRLVITGPEGKGKSTLCRQLAVTIAAGIHPFGGDSFEPRKVLFIDAENGPRHTRRQLRALTIAAGDRIKGNMRIACRASLNLVEPDDAAWLARQCTEVDLLVIGPIYKLTDYGEETDHEARAQSLIRRIDAIRDATGCAVVMEGHQPHGETGRRRPTRPIGSSTWMRWPEFGMHLDDQGVLTHWRGERDQREWPSRLKRGGRWPWTPAEMESDGPKVAELAPKVLEGGVEMSTDNLVTTLRQLGVKGRNEVVREELSLMAEDGRLRTRKGSRNSTLWSLDPFREEEF